jgi:hypothetical protein
VSSSWGYGMLRWAEERLRKVEGLYFWGAQLRRIGVTTAAARLPGTPAHGRHVHVAPAALVGRELGSQVAGSPGRSL